MPAWQSPEAYSCDEKHRQPTTPTIDHVKHIHYANVVAFYCARFVTDGAADLAWCGDYLGSSKSPNASIGKRRELRLAGHGGPAPACSGVKRDGRSAGLAGDSVIVAVQLGRVGRVPFGNVVPAVVVGLGAVGVRGSACASGATVKPMPRTPTPAATDARRTRTVIFLNLHLSLREAAYGESMSQEAELTTSPYVFISRFSGGDGRQRRPTCRR